MVDRFRIYTSHAASGNTLIDDQKLSSVRFKELIAGTNVTLSNTPTSITINSSGGGGSSSGGGNQSSTSVTTTGGTTTLNTTQAAAGLIIVTGTLTSDATLIFPASTAGKYTVVNRTTNPNANYNSVLVFQTSFNLKCKVTGQTNAVYILPGLSKTMFSDGTNMTADNTDLAGAELTLNYADWVGGSYVTIVDHTTPLQNFLLHCQLQALTLKAHVLDDQVQRSYITAYIPRGTYAVSSPIVVPSLVNLRCDGILFRNGTVGTVTNRYTGDTTSQALANLFQPTLIITPQAHCEKVNIYANPDGTNLGSGMMCGKNWTAASIAVGSPGTGYAVNDFVFAACPLMAPYLGMSVQVTSVDGSGAITGVTMTDGGAYDLPPVLQALQWTSANGYSTFDGSGHFTTVSSGSGTGATLNPTWVIDFNANVYWGGRGGLITDSVIDHVFIQGAGRNNSGTYGPQFAIQFWGLNYQVGEIESGGGYHGIYCLFATDVHCDRLNPVNCVNNLTVFGGGAITCPNFVPDTTFSGSYLMLDNTNNVILKGQTINGGAAAGNYSLSIGANSSSGGQVVACSIDMVLRNAGTTSGIPALYMDYCQDVKIDLTVSNKNFDGSATTYLNTSFATFGSHNAASNRVHGEIDGVSGVIYTGTTPAFDLSVWDASIAGYARSNGTYELYAGASPTGTTGQNKAGTGSLLVDYVNGALWQNGGTATSPSWSQFGTSTLTNPPFPNATFSALPAASGKTGKMYVVTDLGDSLWYSNGTNWKPVGGRVNLYNQTTQTNTAGNTGNFSLGTYTLPAGIMGSSGRIEISAYFHATTTGSRAVGFRTDFGASGGATVNSNVTVNGAVTMNGTAIIVNNNATNTQNVGGTYGNNLTQSQPLTFSTLTQDTTMPVVITIYGNAANAADTVFLDTASVDLVFN